MSQVNHARTRRGATRRDAASPSYSGPPVPGSRRRRRGWRNAGAALAISVTVGGATPAAAQPRAAPAVSAAGVPSTLATDLRDRVAAAAARTSQYTDVSRSASGDARDVTWRTLTCQVLDVTIEFHAGEIPQSALAATVAGRTGTASRRATRPHAPNWGPHGQTTSWPTRASRCCTSGVMARGTSPWRSGGRSPA